jgi:sugar lactone lactonase YvrE
LAVDADGNLYVGGWGSDNSGTVRQITPGGQVTTLASGCHDHDYGSVSWTAMPANLACLTQVGGLALDASGAIYVADTGGYLIRKIASAQ